MDLTMLVFAMCILYVNAGVIITDNSVESKANEKLFNTDSKNLQKLGELISQNKDEMIKLVDDISIKQNISEVAAAANVPIEKIWKSENKKSQSKNIMSKLNGDTLFDREKILDQIDEFILDLKPALEKSSGRVKKPSNALVGDGSLTFKKPTSLINKPAKVGEENKKADHKTTDFIAAEKNENVDTEKEKSIYGHASIQPLWTKPSHLDQVASESINHYDYVPFYEAKPEFWTKPVYFEEPYIYEKPYRKPKPIPQEKPQEKPFKPTTHKKPIVSKPTTTEKPTPKPTISYHKDPEHDKIITASIDAIPAVVFPDTVSKPSENIKPILQVEVFPEDEISEDFLSDSEEEENHNFHKPIPSGWGIFDFIRANVGRAVAGVIGYPFGTVGSFISGMIRPYVSNTLYHVTRGALARSDDGQSVSVKLQDFPTENSNNSTSNQR